MKVLVISLALAACGWAQSVPDQTSTSDKAVPERKQERGAAREIGSGAGDIGTGAAKGAGDAAKGTARGVVDLATLHPIDAGVSVGKGAATAGKDVTVGTIKGTAKITKGVGKAIKKIF